MDIQHSLRHLLDVLPLHAEEDNCREDVAESELVSKVQAKSGEFIKAEAVVVLMRRLFESLALLDPTALATQRWVFVSFPASLMARSVLETLATPGNTFFESGYWIQGGHRPPELIEEQRALLGRLENQRISNPKIKAEPIRTVHVTWGIIRLGSRFLLHRREDINRPDVGRYVFPGGRLDITDLPIEGRSPDVLRDLFFVDSEMAKSAQEQTLARELREELDLLPNEYKAMFQRALEPFKKVEGTRNNHVFTQYDIAIYTVLLSQEGELKVLDQAAQNPDEWVWFSASELVAGKRPDGKRAFVDALIQGSPNGIESYLSDDIPDSSSSTPIYRTKSEAIALPAAVGDPVLIGDAGKQNLVPLSLDQDCWELLMLLGWHTRGLEVKARQGLMVMLGGGWIKLNDQELREISGRLVRQLEAGGQCFVECDSQSHCRLSIDTEQLYFQPGCFEYYWDIESEDKPIVLKLRGINTKWAALSGQELQIHLSPAIIKAMPALEDGREPDADPETVRREFKRLMKPTEAVGLHQFISKRMNVHEILVPKVGSQ